VVLLNARWASLETHNTRWRRVVEAWTRHPDIARVVVVDFPAFRPKRAARPFGLVERRTSWLAGADLLAVDVPLPARTTPLDRLVWWWVARSIDRELPAGRRLVVATTPLWVPLARSLPAGVRAFDGMGDWRRLANVERFATRIEAGYREVPLLDVSTVVSDRLAAILGEYGIASDVIPNGVDLDAFEGDPPAPDGLPTAPYAVYVGAIEDRVDVDLLDAVAGAGLTTVVAGPADGAVAERLRRGALHWLGPVPTQLVPGLLRRAAVGLVPHHVNDFTASMDPMKVLEYLAAGLPVVATPVALQPDLAPLVTVVERDRFVAAAVAAAANGRGKPDERALMGREWARVADALLDRYLDR
jgi:teichuronic acid biosynthesis glycosyltransferase TuaH